jgi:hypothetical protein
MTANGYNILRGDATLCEQTNHSLSIAAGQFITENSCSVQFIIARLV